MMDKTVYGRKPWWRDADILPEDRAMFEELAGLDDSWQGKERKGKLGEMIAERVHQIVYGCSLGIYTDIQDQYRGESPQGIEVKLDLRSTETGNVLIEAGERRIEGIKAGGVELVPSGIHKHCNTVSLWLVSLHRLIVVNRMSITRAVAANDGVIPGWRFCVNRHGTGAFYLVRENDPILLAALSYVINELEQVFAYGAAHPGKAMGIMREWVEYTPGESENGRNKLRATRSDLCRLRAGVEIPAEEVNANRKVKQIVSGDSNDTDWSTIPSWAIEAFNADAARSGY